MIKKNIFYAQSGGATAVINATACGVIETARQHSDQLGKVYAGLNGIIGALKEELIDTSLESAADIAALRHTPACAFGLCRYRLKDFKTDDREYRRLLEVFSAHDIGYFFYNGGNDSHDTIHKISELSKRFNYPLVCIGIPKTIDNDLALTDSCPGFGSVAKYVAVSTQEAAMDVSCMAASSTKIFILEVMGRHAGWIAAAAGLAQQHQNDAPHIILFPEITFNAQDFLRKVDETVKHCGYCVIVASEGIKNADGKFLHEGSLKDAFGHEQLGGGVASTLAQLVKQHLGYKFHYAVADYLQRAARHIASQTDLNQAYALGQAAVEFSLAGKNNIMLTIERAPGTEYRWHIGTASLDQVANTESKLPRDYITSDGFGITPKCRQYLQPLIQGEAYPPYRNGLPVYVRLKNILLEKKLTNSFV